MSDHSNDDSRSVNGRRVLRAAGGVAIGTTGLAVPTSADETEPTTYINFCGCSAYCLCTTNGEGVPVTSSEATLYTVPAEPPDGSTCRDEDVEATTIGIGCDERGGRARSGEGRRGLRGLRQRRPERRRDQQPAGLRAADRALRRRRWRRRRRRWRWRALAERTTERRARELTIGTTASGDRPPTHRGRRFLGESGDERCYTIGRARRWGDPPRPTAELVDGRNSGPTGPSSRSRVTR